LLRLLVVTLKKELIYQEIIDEAMMDMLMPQDLQEYDLVLVNGCLQLQRQSIILASKWSSVAIAVLSSAHDPVLYSSYIRSSRMMLLEERSSSGPSAE
jgi:hypothetical protein